MSVSQSHKRWDTSHRNLTRQNSHITSNMRTMGDEVHSHNSSYIYNIENQMETLSSSPYQLGLGG